MTFLLDTNVISEPRRKYPDKHVLAWLEAQRLQDAYLSVVTVGEITQGIARLGESRRAEAYREWIENGLLADFAGRTLELGAEVMRTWGRVTGEAILSGHPVPLMDSLLAATAIAHDMTLVTRNTKDVAALPVKA